MKYLLRVVVVEGGWVKGWRTVFYFHFSISDGAEKLALGGLLEEAANLLSTEGCQSKRIDPAFNCGSLNGKTC